MAIVLVALPIVIYALAQHKISVWLAVLAVTGMEASVILAIYHAKCALEQQIRITQVINMAFVMETTCMATCVLSFVAEQRGVDLFCNPKCATSQFYFTLNQSCLDKCNPPLVRVTDGNNIKYCLNPCEGTNKYLYSNGTCYDSYRPPIIPRFDPGITNSFLYPNGPCLTSCNFPLLNRTEPEVRYCYTPCSDSIYPNGTCENKCPFPLMSRVEPDFKYCFTPCSSTKYLYSDQSCHSSCDFPLVKRLESDGLKYCSTPCNEDEYVYSDGTCRSECEYPHKVLSNPSYKVCSMNIDEIQTQQAHSSARGTDMAKTICGMGGLLTGFLTPGDPTSM